MSSASAAFHHGYDPRAVERKVQSFERYWYRYCPHLGRWSYFIEQFPALVRRRCHELAAPSIPAPTHTPGAGTVDRGEVLCAIKTLPSTDYKSSGRPEIVVEIRGPTTSDYFSQGAGAARGVLDAVLGRSHVTQYILGPFPDHD